MCILIYYSAILSFYYGYGFGSYNPSTGEITGGNNGIVVSVSSGVIDNINIRIFACLCRFEHVLHVTDEPWDCLLVKLTLVAFLYSRKPVMPVADMSWVCLVVMWMSGTWVRHIYICV